MVVSTYHPRFVSRQLKVGNLLLGGNAPIRIQSMTTTDTKDIKATLEQSIRLFDAGAELVRITAPGPNDAEKLGLIRARLYERGYHLPLVADIHFSTKAAMIALEHVEKVRINPGNFVDRKRFQIRDYTDEQYQEELAGLLGNFLPLVRRAKQLQRSLRIGANHGSLSDRIMNRYGDTPLGMVESALEFIRFAKQEDFYDIVVSMKSSNPQVMVQAYRLLVEKFLEEGHDCPLHLGVTEAGSGVDGRMKSALGIGSLLLDQLGDTIRVSLTEDPVEEIYAAKEILATIPQARSMNTPNDVSVTELPRLTQVPSSHHYTDGCKDPNFGKSSSPLAYSRPYTRVISREVSFGKYLRIGGQTPHKVFCSLYPNAELYAVARDSPSKILDVLQQMQDSGCDALWSYGSEDWQYPWWETAQELPTPLAWIQDLGSLASFHDTQIEIHPGASGVSVDLSSTELKQNDGSSLLTLLTQLVSSLARENQGLVLNLKYSQNLHDYNKTYLELLAELQDLQFPAHLPELLFAYEFDLDFFRSPFAWQSFLALKNELLTASPSPPTLLLRAQYKEKAQALYSSSIYLGNLLLEGLGDALLLECKPQVASVRMQKQQFLNSEQTPDAPETIDTICPLLSSGLQLQLDLLQSTRLRLSKTEYISCPSCGRTLFDLEQTTKRIQKKTSHLKGLKIAVMGCIVNGPGEMADADFGYVGAGPGKVHLYKAKELIKPNIPTAQADQELIELIRASGCWQDP